MTNILEITTAELERLIRDSQITLEDRISGDCENCCEPYENEVILRIAK